MERKKMRKGKVYLVGAGPGDNGLLTMRAKELIERCDVLIYDNLVSSRIVDMAPAACEKIYVGKSGSQHVMEQDEINRLIVEKSMAGGLVVRLKGGDPFIFGRGGEEALVCADAGVDFEIVSGVSSAYAVPAYAGIPVTHRGLSSSVAFITGHEDPTKDESDLNWEHLAKGAQTLVFLMGVKNLPMICEKLLENGRAPSTPAAVIENGCLPYQRTVSGTLSTIAERASLARIRPPSIIVIGDVVSLRDRIRWFESRPLYGKRIVVTRSRQQASELTSMLAELGADLIEMPVIRILPLDDPSPVLKAAGELSLFDWIIFTSVNGVAEFFSIIMRGGLDARSLAGRRIGAIGDATADALRRFGIIPDLIPPKFTSADMVRELASRDEIRGKAFLLLRADIAPRDVIEELLRQGAGRVEDVTVYRTVRELGADAAFLKQRINEGSIDLVTFTSSSTAENFSLILRDIGVSPSSIACAAIGPVTAARARELGFTISVTARTHTIPGLVEAVIAHFR